MMVNDSTGNLIVRYWDMEKRSSSVVILGVLPLYKLVKGNKFYSLL